MSLGKIGRKLKRIGKNAVQFRFTSTFEYLDLSFNGTWRPDTLRVVWLRNHRKVKSTDVQWVATEDRGPNGADGRANFEPIISVALIVTLYRESGKVDFQEKEYKYYIENEGPSGKKILATFNCDMSEYAVMPSFENTLAMSFKPVSQKLSKAVLGIILKSEFMKQGSSLDDDMQSTFSAMSAGTDVSFDGSEDEGDGSSGPRLSIVNEGAENGAGGPHPLGAGGKHLEESLKSVLMLGTGETLERTTLSSLAPPKPIRSNSIKILQSNNEREDNNVEVEPPTLQAANEEPLSRADESEKVQSSEVVIVGANVVMEADLDSRPHTIATDDSLDKTSSEQSSTNVTSGDRQLPGDKTPPTQTPTLSQLPGDKAPPTQTPTLSQLLGDKAPPTQTPTLSQLPGDKASPTQTPTLSQLPGDKAPPTQTPTLSQLPGEKTPPTLTPTLSQLPGDKAPPTQTPTLSQLPGDKTPLTQTPTLSQLPGDKAPPTQTPTLPDTNPQTCNNVRSTTDNSTLSNNLSDRQGLVESTEPKSKPREQDRESGGGGYDYVFEAAMSLALIRDAGKQTKSTLRKTVESQENYRPPLNPLLDDDDDDVREETPDPPSPTAKWLGEESMFVDCFGEGVGREKLDRAELIGLYFSASWCPPCRRFLPKLVKFYHHLKQHGKAFEILYISSDYSKQDMMKYMQQQQMPWVGLAFEGKIAQNLQKAFEVSAIPQLKVVSTKGVKASREVHTAM